MSSLVQGKGLAPQRLRLCYTVWAYIMFIQKLFCAFNPRTYYIIMQFFIFLTSFSYIHYSHRNSDVGIYYVDCIGV